ncbi:MAG TPA: response regulator transcription factor [Cyclobacteriaceae bacterium]|nr:response regulator transcription factor [Cyclobacteriaceae bacterium]
MNKELLLFLIDDDLDDQEIFSITVGKISPHFQCVFADDGVFGIERLEQGLRPDMILIDINMPRMNGVDCLTKIRKIPALSNITTYMYSTYADLKIIERCVAIGANGFIKKEPDPEVLQQKLAYILSQLTLDK